MLIDSETGQLKAVASDVVNRCRQRHEAEAGSRSTHWSTPEVKHEFFLEQIELATPPCHTMQELRGQLRLGRRIAGETAAEFDADAVAMPVPVLPISGGTVSPGPRYEHIRRTYGEIADQSLMGALHVHVQVTSDEEGVGVIDRLRPWLPVLLAVSANSPYFRGIETGYDSWRSRIWEMWPTSGPPESFEDAATYHAVTGELIEWGASQDRALVNFGARLSATYPTVEVRVSDVCTDTADTLLVAALVRALVETAADEWRSGAPVECWRSEELRAASWQAARYGVSGRLVHPLERKLGAARDVFASMRHYLAGALAASGDTGLVASGLDRLAQNGNGAVWQRRVFELSGDLTAVIQDLRRRTRSIDPVR
ncbi:MAG: glutamate--cysteine ligase [Propionibacteriales bacterium]|nr:glutamate--cysteine ligase [Propionibacteriales bacterium]